MPLVVDELGLVVTAAPGTGSTSLLEHFRRSPSAVPVPAADVIVDGVVVLDAKHATVAEVVAAGVLAPGELDGRRVLTTTRNPFDFWVAEWQRTRTRWLAELRRPDSWVHRQPGMLGRIIDAVEHDFDSWLDLVIGPKACVGQVMHLNPGHVGEADVVVRMEHLDEDLRAVVGPRSTPVPHLNSTGRERPYWQWYGRSSRELVEQVHAPDLERFGYRF